MAGVRQGQVSDTQLGEDAQRAQRVAQDMRAFHTDEGGDLAGAESRPHLFRRPGVLQVVGVHRDHVLDDVEHLQGIAQVVRRVVEVRSGVVARHIVARRPYRPERAAQSSLPHTWNVHVSGERAVQFRDAF